MRMFNRCKRFYSDFYFDHPAEWALITGFVLALAVTLLLVALDWAPGS